MDEPNGDVGLADVDITYLLVDALFSERLLHICYLIVRDVGPWAHVTRRLRTISLGVERGDRGQGDKATHCKSCNGLFHGSSRCSGLKYRRPIYCMLRTLCGT